jgi:hypothetical protein
MQWCSSHPTWPVLSMAKCWRSTAVNRGLSRPSAVEARRVEEIKMAQKIAIERVDHIG